MPLKRQEEKPARRNAVEGRSSSSSHLLLGQRLAGECGKRIGAARSIAAQAIGPAIVADPIGGYSIEEQTIVPPIECSIEGQTVGRPIDPIEGQAIGPS